MSKIRSMYFYKLVLNGVFPIYRFFDHNVKGELSVVHKLLNVKKTKIDDYNEEKGKHYSKFTKTIIPMKIVLINTVNTVW